MKSILIACAISSPTIGAAQDASSFALYRTSQVDSSLKVHIATFDASSGKDYNFENCWLAAQLFEQQDGVRTRFWCEPGSAEE